MTDIVHRKEWGIHKTDKAPQSPFEFEVRLLQYDFGQEFRSNYLLDAYGDITGIVTINNVPASRPVVLMLKNANKGVDMVWSDPVTGVYTFPNRNTAERYFVLGKDHLGNFSPVIHDTSVQTNIDFNDQSSFDPADFVGTGTIFGDVKNEVNAPLSRRVVLLEYLTYIVVDTTISDVGDGTFAFTGLNNSKIFTVIAEDVLSYTYNDVIFAKISPQDP